MLHRRSESVLGILSPLLLWSIYFLFVYLLAAVACARLSEVGWVRPALWVASVIGIIATLWIGALYWQRLRNRTGQDVEQTTRLRVGIFVASVSLIAVLWTALPTLFLVPCE